MIPDCRNMKTAAMIEPFPLQEVKPPSLQLISVHPDWLSIFIEQDDL